MAHDDRSFGSPFTNDSNYSWMCLVMARGYAIIPSSWKGFVLESSCFFMTRPFSYYWSTCVSFLHDQTIYLNERLEGCFMLILKDFSWEFSRPTSQKCFYPIWVNCNLGGNISLNCDFEIFEDFKIMERWNEVENFSRVKVGIMKDSLMINWEKFKDRKNPFTILVSTIIGGVVGASSSTSSYSLLLISSFSIFSFSCLSRIFYSSYSFLL